MNKLVHLEIDKNHNMTCFCPECGHVIEVFESDLHCTLMDGKNNDTVEYTAQCTNCGKTSYASTAYL